MQALSAKKSNKVVVLATGGTIAGTAPDPGDLLGYRAAQLGVDTLLQALPGGATASLALVPEQIAQVDSKDMGFALWRVLAGRVMHWLGRADVAGVVITHGTDTLEETAFFLHLALPRDLLQRKPVILTCAMRPASARDSDGPQNLQDALGLAATVGASGVAVACAGQIHAASHVQKVHSYRLNAFESGDAGPLGSLGGGEATVGDGPGPDAYAGRFSEMILPNPERWPRVEIVMSHAGAGGALVEALMDQNTSRRSAPVRGIVVAGTGNGTLHGDLEAALHRAETQGIRVVRSTRCVFGQVQPVAGQVIVESSPLVPVKARIMLMMALMQQDLAENG